MAVAAALHHLSLRHHVDGHCDQLRHQAGHAARQEVRAARNGSVGDAKLLAHPGRSALGHFQRRHIHLRSSTHNNTQVSTKLAMPTTRAGMVPKTTVA
eukprot:365990-Chlamydomonas_euryale.AAC.15